MIIPLSVLAVAAPATGVTVVGILLVLWGGRNHPEVCREEVERKKILHAHQTRAEEVREARKQRQAEEARAARKKYLSALDDRTEEMVAHVNLVNTREHLGYRVTGRKAVGMERVTMPYPTGTWEVRQIAPGDYAQAVNLLPQELTLPDRIRRLRILSGEALIRVPIEDRVIYEDIYEPEYKIHHKALYVLWDVSPSMWHLNRPDIWRRLLALLSRKAQNNKVALYYRGFGSHAGPLNRVITDKEHARFRSGLESVTSISGTSLEDPLSYALEDFESIDYDDGIVVVVSDGEVDEDLTPFIEKFRNRRLTLHALMVGADNEPLRKISHTYQMIDEHLNISSLETQTFGLDT